MTFITVARNFTQRNAPLILTIVGSAGVVSAVGSGIWATTKATEILECEKVRRSIVENVEYEEVKMTGLDVAKTVWKVYIPTALLTAVSLAAIIGSHNISAHRLETMATLWTLSDKALSTYKEKVAKELGKDAEETVSGKLAQDKLAEIPVETQEIHMTGNGGALFFDSTSGRYFNSDLEFIRKVQNDFNQTLLAEDTLSLNQFYDALGLEHTSLGDDLGWSTEFGMLDIHFTTKLATNSRPCIVMDYRIGPHNI